jgi:hypothetical protein
MRDLLQTIHDLLFGKDGPMQLREPEPPTRSEKWVVLAGAVFAVSAALYLLLTVGYARKFCESRHEDLMQECLLDNVDFRWCYKNVQ